MTEEMTTPWIASKTRKMNGDYKDWPTTQKRNVQRLQTAEQKGRLDFILYGDSITSFHYGYTISQRNPGTDTIWKKYFGDLNAVPLAIAGDQIGNVLWRLQKGKETPKEDPRAIGFLIGVNDILRFGEDKTQTRVPSTATRMKTLLTWVNTHMPDTAVLLCGLTPTTNPNVLTERLTLNATYKSLANTFTKRGMHIRYTECAASITNADGTPKGTDYLADTVHLTAKGHKVELKAMRKAVDSLLSSTPTSSTNSTTSTKTINNTYMIAAVFVAVWCCCCCMSSILVTTR